jgi:hypothetical protein
MLGLLTFCIILGFFYRWIGWFVRRIGKAVKMVNWRAGSYGACRVVGVVLGAWGTNDASARTPFLHVRKSIFHRRSQSCFNPTYYHVPLHMSFNFMNRATWLLLFTVCEPRGLHFMKRNLSLILSESCIVRSCYTLDTLSRVTQSEAGRSVEALPWFHRRVTTANSHHISLYCLPTTHHH